MRVLTFSGVFTVYMACINTLIRFPKFPNDMKQTDIIPAYKKLKAIKGKL